MENDEYEFCENKRICINCVGEKFLKSVIGSSGEIALCDYCGAQDTTWTIDQLADHVEKAFEDHYVRTPTDPDSYQSALLADRESDYSWFREGQRTAESIAEAAGIPEEAADDVQSILEDRHGDVEAARMGVETEFERDAYYDLRRADSSSWQREWDSFEVALKTEARFFSGQAEKYLSKTFNGVEKLKTHDGRAPVIDVGPGLSLSHLFRARVFQSEEKLKEALGRPDLHLGSPPSHLAATGRMNARGISVFYSATTANTAVAEVRPPVGSRVVVARFALVRQLKLLDLTSLSTLRDADGSIFDPGYKPNLERIAFLRILGGLLTRPVMPDDESFDYLPTQAIADFLATQNTPLLDGIIFKSAQERDGINVVLFHNAALVEQIDIPTGTTFYTQTHYNTEDGPEFDYSVTEESPSIEQSTDSVSDPFTSLNSCEKDCREITLQIDLESIEVHHVESVRFECSAYGVDRRRMDKNRRKF